YLKEQPMPHAIEKQVRNVWSLPSEIDARGAVLVCPHDDCANILRKAHGRFRSQFKKLGLIEAVRHGVVFRKLNVYYLPPVRPVSTDDQPPSS
ncbi:MAG: hypothetical protein ABIK68_22370, partial [bacterium]